MISIWAAIIVLLLVWGICLIVVLALQSRIKELRWEVGDLKWDRDYWKKLFDNVTKEARTKKSAMKGVEDGRNGSSGS